VLPLHQGGVCCAPPSLPDADNGVMPNAEDDVDSIVRAWATQRPDLDTSPFLVLSRITRISTRLDRLRRRVFRRHGLDVWEFDVLATLRRAGAPFQLTPSELIAHNLVSSGAMTNRINRLEAKGLVSREADQEDGRKVVVTLQRSGRELVDRALEDLLVNERALLSGLSAEDRQSLARALRALSLTLSP
jgi:DNA-binding MarR family transcriptional regulator